MLHAPCPPRSAAPAMGKRVIACGSGSHSKKGEAARSPSPRLYWHRTRRRTSMKNATRAYVIQFGSSMLAYSVVLLVSVALLNNNPHAPWRVPVALAPVVPACFAPLHFVHAAQIADERQQRIQLDAIGLSFGATGILTFAYGFLENAGFP